MCYVVKQAKDTMIYLMEINKECQFHKMNIILALLIRNFWIPAGFYLRVVFKDKIEGYDQYALKWNQM